MPTYKPLTYDDRKIIEKMCKFGASSQEIADTIDKTYSTIYRELRRCPFNSYNIGVDDNCLFDPHYSNCSDCFHINQYYSNYNYDSGFNRRGRKNCADCIAGRK